MYKISVIIPLFNREDSIKTALNSFLESSLRNIEAIIIDDGSTDNSAYIVEEYCKKYDYISLIKTTHQGPGLARNLGIKKAQGEYICFMDSDDIIPKDAYLHLYSMAKNKNADLVIGGYLRKVENSPWKAASIIKEYYNLYGEKNINEPIDLIIKQPAVWNKIFKKEIIKHYNIKFLSLKISEDLLFCLDYLKYTNKVYITDEIVYLYETALSKRKSIISTESNDIIKDGFISLEMLTQKYPPNLYYNTNKIILENNLKFFLDRFSDTIAKDEELFAILKKYILHFSNKKYNYIIKNLLKVDTIFFKTLDIRLYKRLINKKKITT